MHRATPSYDSLSNIEQIKQAAIQKYEAEIQKLERLKQELNGKLQTALDGVREQINTALKQHDFAIQSLKTFQVDENSPLHDNLIAYKNELVYIATRPQQTLVNKSKLESLSKKIENDVSSSEDDPNLNKLKLLTDFLKVTSEIADRCKQTESNLQAQIDENSAEIDGKIATCTEEIAKLRGGSLEHVATYQRNLQGDLVQTFQKK
jgi:hypothetical protein